MESFLILLPLKNYKWTVLSGRFQFFHNPIDSTIASTDDVSIYGTSRNAPLSASFIAARVTALGSL